MTLSADVAELENQCAELARKIDTMTDDPVVDYASLYIGAGGIEIEYGIKDWEWEAEYPRILLSEVVRDEIRLNERDHIEGLISAFQQHVDTLKKALEKWPAEGTSQPSPSGAHAEA